MRYLRRFLIAFGGEVLQSGLHFTLNIALIRLLPKEGYGLFASVFLLAGWAVSLGNSLAATHVGVHLPRAGSWAKRKLTEAVFASVSLYLSLTLLILTSAGLYAWTRNLEFALSGALVPALWTFRNHMRAVAYARLRPDIAAISDIGYCASGTLSAICTFLFLPAQWLLVGVFSTLAFANLVGIGTAAYSLTTPLYAVRQRTLARHYKPVMAESLWMVLGVTTTALQTMAYAPLVAAIAGPAAVAPLAAGNVLFGPVRTAIAAWQNSMRPELAKMIGQGRYQAAQSFCQTSALIIVALSIFAGIALIVLWAPLDRALFAKHYAGEPMLLIVLLWWGSIAFFALRAVPSGVAQVFRDFDGLAWATVYGSFITMVLTAFLLWHTGSHLAPMANIVAESFVALWVWRLATSRLGQRPAGTVIRPNLEGGLT